MAMALGPHSSTLPAPRNIELGRDRNNITTFSCMNECTALSLENVHDDVFGLIVNDLQQFKGAVRSVASTSCRLRQRSIPALFARCVADPCGRSGVPPVAIRPFARHLTYTVFVTYLDVLQNSAQGSEDYPGMELQFLPQLRSITFARVLCGVPWVLFHQCLLIRTITAVTIEKESSFIDVEPYPEAGDAFPNALEKFSYEALMWREVDHEIDELSDTIRSMQEEYALEGRCLSSVILSMSHTARSLNIPAETAPLADMRQLSWPHLHDFSLYGQYLHSSQASILPSFLSRTPHIQRLSIQAAERRGTGRVPVLGQVPLTSADHWELRSLKIAYPDPDDSIFSFNMVALKHLSLCDWPRYHHRVGGGARYSCHKTDAPILSSIECLTILKRMDMPLLTSLELVYLVEGDDDALLHYVTGTFPRLEHLELHRYRRNRKEVVRYEHICHLLTASQSLRSMHLNLDFHDECGSYARDRSDRAGWTETLINTRGPEIVNILEACQRLEIVAFLCHGYPCSAWMEFRIRRGTKPRCVFEREGRHRDSVAIPYTGWW